MYHIAHREKSKKKGGKCNFVLQSLKNGMLFNRRAAL